MSVESELELFGVKLKKDLQRSLNEKQRAKAAKYGRSYNENSTLSASIIYTVKEQGNAVEFQLFMEGYGRIVDKGRRPGPVSEKGSLSIENWIKIKGINPSKILSTPGKKPIPFEQAKKTFAFLVARKIKKKGFEGNHFYTPILNDGRLDKLKIDLEKELNKEVLIVIRDGSNS